MNQVLGVSFLLNRSKRVDHAIEVLPAQVGVFGQAEANLSPVEKAGDAIELEARAFFHVGEPALKFRADPLFLV